MSTKELRSFARSKVFSTLERRTEKGGFDRSLWREMAELGLVGMIAGKEYGGGEGEINDFVESVALLAGESLDLGLALSLLDHVMLCVYPLKVFGSRKLKERYLPPLCRGERIGAAAVSEPESGGDPSHMRTTARKTDDGYYVIEGVKGPVTNAPVADLFLVIASTDPEAGKEGLTAFMVERADGVRVEEMELGFLPTSPHGRVFLEGSRVVAENMVGEEGGGHERISRSLFIWERAALIPVIIAYIERWHHMLVSSLDPSHIQPELRILLAQRKVELTAYRVLSERLLELTFGESENGRDRAELLLFFGKALPEWVASMREVVEKVKPPQDAITSGIERDLRLLEVGGSILDWQFQKLLF
jgi:alkylation response protein AidB-like acyl-CoA dehydrogenase